MKVIENAKQAKTTWDEKIDEKTKEKFRKYFHLRPATEYITIVSTHKRKYMNGLKVSKCNLEQGIVKCAEALCDAEKLKEVNIKLRNGNTRTFLTTKRPNKEYTIQAKFINEIIRQNIELKKLFDVVNLHLIGSEIILPGKKDKIDILAYGNTNENKYKLFFIEVKETKGDKKEKAFEQVRRYMKTYIENKDFITLINNYPMLEENIDITKFEPESWVVKGNTNETKISYKGNHYIEVPQEV